MKYLILDCIYGHFAKEGSILKSRRLIYHSRAYSWLLLLCSSRISHPSWIYYRSLTPGESQAVLHWVGKTTACVMHTPGIFFSGEAWKKLMDFLAIISKKRHEVLKLLFSWLKQHGTIETSLVSLEMIHSRPAVKCHNLSVYVTTQLSVLIT